MAGLELHEACAVGDYDTLEELLSTGKYDVNLKDVEWKNKTPLHWACSKGLVDIIRLLLEHGAKGTSRMIGGWTPAHCAAETGKITALRALHTANVAIDRKDKYQDTPRDIALLYGHADCVKYLEQAELERIERRKKAGKEAESDEEEEETEEL